MDVPAFDDSLRTGNETIDSQHEWLFTLAARVATPIERCSAGAGPESSADAACEGRTEDAVAEAIYGLIDYITEHFADEELLMVSTGYPGASVHKSLHEDLSKRVGTYTLRYFNGDEVAAPELVAFFKMWLTSHIMVHDREFTTWLSESQR